MNSDIDSGCKTHLKTSGIHFLPYNIILSDFGQCVENRIFIEIGIFHDFGLLTASHNLADYGAGSVKKSVWGPEKASRDLQKCCTYLTWWLLMVKKKWYLRKKKIEGVVITFIWHFHILKMSQIWHQRDVVVWIVLKKAY